MSQGQKFQTLDRLSKTFDAVSTKWGGLSAVVEAANNFLGGYVPQTKEDVQRLLYDAATNPGSLGASVMVTSHTPNSTPEDQRKKEEEAARDAYLAALQQQIRDANERISKMIDECMKMAEWCRKQAEKAGEAMEKIAAKMSKNSEIISDFDEAIESNKATGHFDREKVRRRLAERGVKTKDDISDKKLIELAEKARLDLLQDNNDQSKLHDEFKRLKEASETEAQEFEKKAQEMKQSQKELNKGDLSPEEQKQQLTDKADQYEGYNERKEKVVKENEKKLDELNSKLNESLFDEPSSSNEPARVHTDSKSSDSISREFSIASDASAKINPEHKSLETSLILIQISWEKTLNQ
jgi:hypothetical protein